MEPAVDDIEFVKLASLLDLGAEDMQKYIGDYNLNGTTVKVYLRGDGVLMVLVPGQPDYELEPLKQDQFKLKIADGYEVHFEIDDKNSVISLSFVQPNGTFKAMRI